MERNYENNKLGVDLDGKPLSDHQKTWRSDDLKVNNNDINNPYHTFDMNGENENNEDHRFDRGNPQNLDNQSTYSVTKPNSNFFHALINFTKSFIGIGPLTIAAAMRHAGVVLGPIWIVIWGFLCLYGVNIMVETRRKLLKNKFEENREFAYLPNNAQRNYRELRPEEIEDDNNINEIDSRDSWDQRIHGRHKIKTYSDLGREAYGDWGYYAVNFVIFFQQMTIITAYFYFLNKYFPSYLVLIVIIPIWMFWGLRKISYVSFMSLTFVTFVLFGVIGYSINDINKYSKENLRYFDVFNLPLFFGVWVFQFEGNTAWLQIENSMKSPKNFWRVSSVSIAFIIVFKWSLALSAYIAYAENVNDIVIYTLPDNTFRKVLGYVYWAAIVGSMPIQLNPISDTFYRTTFLDGWIKLFRDNPTTKYYIGAIVAISTCAVIALLIPELQLLFNIAGSAMGIFTMTIFPVMFYNKVFWKEITWTRWGTHIAMNLIISTCGLVSIWYTIYHS